MGGAEAHMDEAGVLQGIKLFAGTSMGALVAALCAVGYSGDEMVQAPRTAREGARKIPRVG